MTTITIERKLLEQAFGQLRCNTSNLQKGMSKSIQKLCARENAEVLEILHAALAAPAAAPESLMTEIDCADDDALRFVQRVLESNAPESDKKAARDMVVEIRTRVLKARASKPSTGSET